MSRLRVGKSYWLDRYTATPRRFPALHGRHQCDVVVIGGGITGCLAAARLASARVRVTLVDAKQIGRGSTAASTALVMQEPDVDFRDLIARHGFARARRVWLQSRRSLRALTALLRRNRVHASLETVPSVYWTADREVASDLRHEITRRRRAGIPAEWLSAEALERISGIAGAAGILTRGNAQLDPYRACLGIAALASAAGARLFERSPVTRITGERTGVRVALEHAEVRADWAVIATGYATPAFKPLAGRFRMTTTYVITTARLSASERREIGLGRVMLWDTDEPYHYARWTPDGRLMIGGEDEPRKHVRNRSAALERHARSLTSHLASLYPALAHVEPEYAWDGLFATTPDGLPYIGPHRHYPRQLFALGYGGNGITFGHLASEIVGRYVLGKNTAEDDFFGFGRLNAD